MLKIENWNWNRDKRFSIIDFSRKIKLKINQRGCYFFLKKGRESWERLT